MNSKNFRAVSVTVLVPKGQDDGAADDLNNFSSAVGLYSFGTESRPLTREEWKEVRENVPEDILGEQDEIQRRDEKHGAYGGKEDVAN